MYLHHGDSREVLKTYPDNHFDSIVCDPPYALTSVSKRWAKGNNRQVATHGVFNRVSRGFMNQQWDNGSVAFDPEFWSECLRVLKPGGHLVAFGGTRTHHRLWCAVEDAGFEIRESLAWMHAQGFPKSRNVSKEMDKAAKAEREVIGKSQYAARANTRTRAIEPGGEGHRNCIDTREVTAPATDLAKQWDGWGTALKPAMELICMARKPLSEKSVAANVERWGTGAINIDGCRVPTGDKLGGGGGYSPNAVYSQPGWVRPWMSDPASQQNHMEVVQANIVRAETLGRWPANLLHDGSPEALFTFPESASGSGKHPAFSKAKSFSGIGIGPESSYEFAAYDDAGRGSAARFFYCAKASVKEREFGLEDEAQKPIANTNGDDHPSYADYQGKRKGARANNHPTTKPLALMRYLVRLVTPPNGTVLDCFMGSGSTGVAAIQEGFNFVGVEQDAGYFAIASRRIAAARGTTPPCDEAVSSITTRTVPLDDGEGGSSFPQAMPR